MNGGHDLGGMHGLGPIDPEPEEGEPVFHSEWEQRVFALSLAVGFLRHWNLDESRHARERQHPADYMRNSYYENWLNGLVTLLVEKGLVTQSELDSGTANHSEPPSPAAVLKATDVETAMLKGGPVNMEIDHPPRFQIGDPVRVVNMNPDGHTRLPRYARAKQGVVDHHHGAHVYPDSQAHGIREGQHLYSVSFSAAELWGQGNKNDFQGSIDMWEPYLNIA